MYLQQVQLTTEINTFTDVEEYTDEGLTFSQNVQQCVAVLLDKGVSVDCQDSQGLTPLHWALQLPSKLVYISCAAVRLSSTIFIYVTCFNTLVFLQEKVF